MRSIDRAYIWPRRQAYAGTTDDPTPSRLPSLISPMLILLGRSYSIPGKQSRSWVRNERSNILFTSHVYNRCPVVLHAFSYIENAKQNGAIKLISRLISSSRESKLDGRTCRGLQSPALPLHGRTRQCALMSRRAPSSRAFA